MVALDDAGAGPPLVLVHGLASSRVAWRALVPRLAAAGRRVLAVDVPGFGASPPVGPGFDLAAVARALLRGIEDAGVDTPFDLVGHSMGGAIALTLCDLAPDRVRRTVLAAPAGLRPFPPLAARLAGVGADPLIRLRARGSALADQAWGRRFLLAAGVVDARAIAPADTRALMAASATARRTAEALSAVAAADLRPVLDRVAPPTLVWGRHDRVVPLRVGLAVAATRPWLTLDVLEDAGHLAMLERPGAFAAALERAFTGSQRLDPPHVPA